ncbi:uncharacterized protein LOC143425188 [Xylocopa sonorina]|uniref:uncharacterized protein LOC143425188 n=1 Tax=Xylocopa sonorina TaxID=1818115 RepID=UPI00403AAE1E
MPLYRVIIILFVVATVYSYTPPTVNPSCSCDHCNRNTEKGVEEENKNTTLLHKEDSDGDGNRTICARDREFNDRTFPSVCHMLCYNRCLVLRLSTVMANGTQQYVVVAFRNNYYKLRDGEC